MKPKASPQGSPLTRQPSHKDYLPKSKREFYVEEHRKQIDDYMLGQIKKSKKSVRHIKKQLNHFQSQIDHLKHLNKKQRSEYRSLALEVHYLRREKSNEGLDTTTRKQFSKDISLHTTTQRQLNKNNQSSQVSRTSSGIHPIKNKSLSKTFSKPKSCSHEKSSKQLLKNKIENLKQKAYMMRESADKIRFQINQKIAKKLGHSRKADDDTNIEGNGLSNANTEAGYNELLKLLKTNKLMQASQQQAMIEKREEVRLATDEMVGSDKSMISTEKTSHHPRSTPHYTSQPRSNFQTSQCQLPSETNLLESNKTIKGRQRLKLTKMSDLQLKVNQGQYQSRVKLPFEHNCSGPELSFQNISECEKQLKQLQFEFDQLVRQQLLSNDLEEKSTLVGNIRILLTRIGQLKQELKI